MSEGGSTEASADDTSDASVGDAVSLASTLRDGIAPHALTPEQFAVVAEVIDRGEGKRYKPLRVPIVNKAIELGAAEGIVPAVLPLLALLTSRRLSMLIHLNADWLSCMDGHWVCYPTDYVEIDGRTRRARAKTDHSLLPFVIHDQLVAMGMVGFVKRKGSLFGPALSTKNSAAAISTRMNGLLAKAGAGGRDGREVFHSLRTNGIVHYRQHTPDLCRHQSGHAPDDPHSG